MSAIQTADRALKRFQRSGAMAANVPTSERLLRDAGNAHIESTLSCVDIEDADGILRPVAVRGSHVRITSEAFERMGARCLLGPGDPDRNRELLTAARRLHADWTHAGLSPLQGQDPGKIRSTAIGAGLLGTERKCEAFKAYTDAVDVLDRGERVAVEAIVLHDKLAVWVGSKISGLVDKGGSKAVAMYALRRGLEKLAIHYGIMAAPIQGPADDVIAALRADTETPDRSPA